MARFYKQVFEIFPAYELLTDWWMDELLQDSSFIAKDRKHKLTETFGYHLYLHNTWTREECSVLLFQEDVSRITWIGGIEVLLRLLS